MKVDESNYSIIERASKTTGANFEIKWFDAENIDGYIEAEEMMYMIDELIGEIDRLQESLDDLEHDLHENYIRRSIEEEVCISDRDFI